MNSSQAAAVATYLGITINIIGLAALFWQVRVLVRQVRQANHATELDHERRRKQATIDLCNTLMERAIDVRELVRKAKQNGNFYDLFDSETEQGQRNQLDLIRLLNLYDNAAVGVRHDVYDLCIVADTVGFFVSTLVVTFKDVIEQRRVDLRFPALWLDLEVLAHKIRDRGIQASQETSIDWTRPSRVQ